MTLRVRLFCLRCGGSGWFVRVGERMRYRMRCVCADDLMHTPRPVLPAPWKLAR